MTTTGSVGVEVMIGVDWVMCDRCEAWYHGHCQGVNKEVLKFFQSSERPFLCATCATDVPDLFRAKDFLKDIGRKIGELEKDMGELKERMGTVENKTNFKESEEFKAAGCQKQGTSGERDSRQEVENYEQKTEAYAQCKSLRGKRKLKPQTSVNSVHSGDVDKIKCIYTNIDGLNSQSIKCSYKEGKPTRRFRYRN